MKKLAPEPSGDRTTELDVTTTVMMFVGTYGKASTRWLPATLHRLLDAPAVVIDLTEARITDAGVVDELIRLRRWRALSGRGRERMVMTDEQANEPTLRTLVENFDVMPDLNAAVDAEGGLTALDFACEPRSTADGARPLILTLEAPEWDIDSSDALAALLAPATDCADVVVDLSAVSYIDSTCLGKLVGMRVKRSAKGFEPARLVVTSPRVRRLFSIVHFDKIWPIFETLDEALRAAAASHG